MDAYRSVRQDDTDHTCFAEDLEREIQTFLMPYLSRLHATGYIKDKQIVDLLVEIDDAVTAFREEMKEDPALTLAKGIIDG